VVEPIEAPWLSRRTIADTRISYMETLMMLSDEDRNYLQQKKFSPVPNLGRAETLAFCRKEMKTDFRAGAIARAFSSGELPTALISGKARASEFDIAVWVLRKKYRHEKQKETPPRYDGI